MLPVDRKVGHERHRFGSHLEIVRVPFDAHGSIAHGLRRRERRSRSGEGIDHHAFTERQHAPHELAEKRLRLETGVGSDGPLPLSGRGRPDDVAKRRPVRRPAKSPGTPFPQVVLNPAFDRFAKQYPRFPHRPRQHADAFELLVSTLGAVPAAHGHDQPDDLSPSLQPAARQGRGHDMRQQRTGGDHDIRPRHQLRDQQARPDEEELMEVLLLCIGQRGESRQRRPRVTIERWRQSPNSSPACSQLRLLFRRVLLKPVRRIGDHGMDRMVFPVIQPVEAVAVDQRGLTVAVRILPSIQTGHRSLDAVCRIRSQIDAATFLDRVAYVTGSVSGRLLTHLGRSWTTRRRRSRSA